MPSTALVPGDDAFRNQRPQPIGLTVGGAYRCRR